MALGGGVFTTQNKKLPGAYINFVSASQASAALSDRGVCAVPMALDWGDAGAVLQLTNSDFLNNSIPILGHEYTSDYCMPFRELFKNARMVYVYNLVTGSTKASNEYCTAKKAGARGNDIKLVITQNVDDPTKFDVKTLLDNLIYDEQKAVVNTNDLTANDYVEFKPDVSLALTASLPLAGGSNGEGVKAECEYATAKVAGQSGNNLKIDISGATGAWTIAVLNGSVTVFSKEAYTSDTIVPTELENDYVVFKAVPLAVANVSLTGGAENVTAASWQQALSAFESYTFNTLGLATNDDSIKKLATAYTDRLRDEVGVKFQTVLFKHAANDKGVINVVNGLNGDEFNPSIVYWTTGAECGCDVNETLTNSTYTGELDLDVSRTQAQLEECVDGGQFVFHRVGDEVRVLTDINSKTSVTVEEGEDFKSNQTMRVLDQIGNDIAVLFNDRFLGKVPNDNAGRVSLWNAIAQHHQELARIRAIEDFDPENITVEQGNDRKTVLVNDYVTPVNALEKLYMYVMVQ